MTSLKTTPPNRAWRASAAQTRANGPRPVPMEPLMDQSGFVRLSSLFEVMWRRRALLAAFATSGLILGVVAATLQKKVYSAKAGIEIRMPNEEYMNRRQLDPVTQGGVFNVDPYLQTQLRLINSDQLLMRVAARLNAASHADFRDPKTGRPGTEADVIAGMHDRLSAALFGQTHIAEITYESSDPKFAADVVNTLVAEYSGLTQSRVGAETNSTAAYLTAQLAELRNTLEQSERQLEQFIRANGLLAAGEPQRDSIEETRLRQMQAGLSAAEDSRIAEQSRYESLRNAPADSLADLLDSDTLRAYRVKLTETSQRLAEANQIYTPSHYRVKQIQAELDEVKRAFERERQAQLKRARSQYETAVSRERAVRAEHDAQKSVVARQTTASIRYATLKREVESNRQLYESTLQKSREAAMASRVPTENALVVDAAVAPLDPVRPRRSFYALLGMVAGGFLGLAYVLFREEEHKHSKSAVGYARHALPVMELGAIPAGRPRGAHPELEKAPIELISYTHPRSPLSESFRGVLTSILLGEGGQPRVIVVASADSGEGRTTVASNLAIALAETGKSVLLIDADRNDPKLHELYGLGNDWGFYDMVFERADQAPGPPTHCVYQSRMNGLCVLPVGRPTDTSFGLLVDNPRLQNLMDLFRSEYDAVIIDTPPGIDLADSRAIAKYADGVVLVVRPGITSMSRASTLVQRINADGTPILGNVFNGAHS